MLNKGQVSKWIYQILKEAKTISESELYERLFCLQTEKLVPIAPFSIQNDEPKSEFVDVLVSDLVGFRYLTKKHRTLSLTSKGQRISEDMLLSGTIPPTIPFKTCALPYKKEMAVQVQGKSLGVGVEVPVEVYNFSSSLPVAPETGILFSLHDNNPLLSSPIPLFSHGEKTFYVFAEKPAGSMQLDNLENNFRRLKNLGYNWLKTGFDLQRFLNAMEIIYYCLLPFSATQLEVGCRRKHTNKKYFEDYVETFLTPEQLNCSEEGCMSSIDYTAYIISNEKIFSCWKKGMLMEWFGAAVFRKSGADWSLWHTKILGEECDAIASRGEQLVIIECKRTYKYDSSYEEGIMKLRRIKSKLKSNVISAKAVIFTTIPEAPRKEEGVDLVVTTQNYSEFCNNPYSFF